MLIIAYINEFHMERYREGKEAMAYFDSEHGAKDNGAFITIAIEPERIIRTDGVSKKKRMWIREDNNEDNNEPRRVVRHS